MSKFIFLIFLITSCNNQDYFMKKKECSEIHKKNVDQLDQDNRDRALNAVRYYSKKKENTFFESTLTETCYNPDRNTCTGLFHDTKYLILNNDNYDKKPVYEQYVIKDLLTEETIKYWYKNKKQEDGWTDDFSIEAIEETMGCVK